MTKNLLKEEKPIIKDKVEALLSHLSLLNRGDRITHRTLETIIGCPKATGIWQSVLTKTRRRLRNGRGITLSSIHGVGYELTKIDEQISSENRLRRAIRQLGRDATEKHSIRASELTVHQQRVRAITANAAYTGKLAVQRQLRSSRKAVRTRETIPSIGAVRAKAVS